MMDQIIIVCDQRPKGRKKTKKKVIIIMLDYVNIGKTYYQAKRNEENIEAWKKRKAMELPISRELLPASKL